MIPRFLVSAAHKSSGKTTLSIGICAELARLGRRVQPFKKGPDYIDPLWLGQAADNPCHNLDFYTQGEAEILQGFSGVAGDAEVALIEGNKGLFDGMDMAGSNSNAALARLLKAPVILVIDTQGMSRGIAPLLLGYQSFEPQTPIAGVILNKVAGSRHERKLREAVARYTDLPVLGAVQRSPALQIVERHLGLMPSNESRTARLQIEAIREQVAREVDLDQLLGIAAGADSLPEAPPVSGDAGERVRSRLRIGIARDEAFGFYYPGDLQALAREADLVPFSPMGDRSLPAVDGLFIGGGFPELRMAELEANLGMRGAIRDYVEAGGPLYAECGGLMYLSRSIAWQGKRAKMVGLVPADAVMYERPQGRGYVRLRHAGDFPWPVVSGTGQDVPAHEFHYSRLENLAPDQTYAFEVLRGSGIDGAHDGLVYKNMLASYTHLRDVQAYPWTRMFLDHVRACMSPSGNHDQG
jgi:cobyrinic acid a,c-diamide synthase